MLASRAIVHEAHLHSIGAQVYYRVVWSLSTSPRQLIIQATSNILEHLLYSADAVKKTSNP